MSQELASFIAVLPAIMCTVALATIIHERMEKGSTELLDRICSIVECLAPSGEEEPERRIR